MHLLIWLNTVLQRGKNDSITYEDQSHHSQKYDSFPYLHINDYLLGGDSLSGNYLTPRTHHLLYHVDHWPKILRNYVDVNNACIQSQQAHGQTYFTNKPNCVANLVWSTKNYYPCNENGI